MEQISHGSARESKFKLTHHPSRGIGAKLPRHFHNVQISANPPFIWDSFKARVTRAARVKICSTIISSAPKHAKQVRQKYGDIERIMIVQKNSRPSWRKKSTAWKVTGSIRYPSPLRKQIKDDLQPTGMKLLKCVIPDSSGWIVCCAMRRVWNMHLIEL